MSWFKIALLEKKDYIITIDIQTSCKIIDGIIKAAWKDFGKIFRMPKDLKENLSLTNSRQPTLKEWEDLILYARNKCLIIDSKYFLKDPDPTSNLNKTEPAALYIAE